jgi:preprotein translocase subunit SecA
MLALNDWTRQLAPQRESLISKWPRAQKNALHQLLNIEGALTPKQEKLVYRIALLLFKSIHPKEEWRGWMGENQAVQGVFDEKQKGLKIQKEELKKRLCTQSRDVQNPLGEKEIDQVLLQYFKVLYYMEKWSSYSLTELHEMGQKGLKETLSPEKSLALASLVMKKTDLIVPYDIQLLAVLGVLSKKEGKGSLAQVKTGEGKTMIVTLLAFTLVMQGRSVDIVSSSDYLAMRDQKKGDLFFQNFGIVTSHICEKEEKTHFNAHILYGKATDYEFALMREKLYQKKLFACPSRTKTFDCVIVDEVDNMLIDTACNSARIAYPSLKESKHRFYPLIYLYVKEAKNLSAAGLKLFLSSREIQDIPFSDQDLLELIQAAQMAISQKEGVDYVLHTAKDPIMGEKFAIKIIDHKNTGQIQEGMRWSSGIHEFLEVKHGIELDQETMTPISLSHAIYYDLYQNIYGFSGTLGSMFEREYIKTSYQVDLFDLPPYRPSLREDFSIEQFESLEELRSQLIHKTKSIQEKERPVLILCQSINETRELSQLFHQATISHQLYNEMQEEHADIVIQKGGEPGMVTLSTNNGGRGTDIVLSEKSLHHGGLHVIFTYYPNSKRVEDQGIGRAGRQGQPGSSEILVVTKNPREELSTERLNHEKVYAQVLTKRALLEREVHLYVNLFWKEIGEWKEKATSGESIHKIITTLPNGKEFEIEELILKREEKLFQIWSDSFVEPSEGLMQNYQLDHGDIETFKERLRELYDSSKALWNPQ